MHVCSVRLFSTKSLKPLGTLAYHKVAVQTLAFAHAWSPLAPHHHRDLPTGRAGAGRTGKGGASDEQISLLAPDKSDAGKSGDDDAIAGGDDAADDDTDEGEDVGEGERGGGDDDDDDDGQEEDEDEDEMSAEEKARRARWLVSGGKDGRVAVWALMDFTRQGR